MYKKSLSYPHLVWMTLFVVVPIVLVLIYSLTVVNLDGSTYISLEHYKDFFNIKKQGGKASGKRKNT